MSLSLSLFLSFCFNLFLSLSLSLLGRTPLPSLSSFPRNIAQLILQRTDTITLKGAYSLPPVFAICLASSAALLSWRAAPVSSWFIFSSEAPTRHSENHNARD